MSHNELAGKPVPASLIIDVHRLTESYYSVESDPDDPAQRVSFGTSGHRGSSLNGSFNESHILAISQAVSEYRTSAGIEGPLFIGIDTHALSEPAFVSAVEVLSANGIEVRYQEGQGFTPTPVISHAILTHNRNPSAGIADGVIITPSHNPPQDGGFKYNPPTGGPADTIITSVIEKRANDLLRGGLKDVKRRPFENALRASNVRSVDFRAPYIEDLDAVIDMDAIAASSLRIGADPMGGAGAGYWDPIAERYGIDLTVVNDRIDPTFSFMRVDWDGKIRMDCSSAHAMAGLIDLRERFDLAFGNDPDFDRHGIVTRSDGLLNPNHYLAVAIQYLFERRTKWPTSARIGKTLVSSSMIDRVAGSLDRSLSEVPVGFKWFVQGLLDGSFGFGGEESAGASFLRRDGSAWTTDKDGFIMNLLAAEILAVTGKDPAELYAELTHRFGRPVYERIEVAASVEQKLRLKNLNAEDVPGTVLAGEEILQKLTRAPGNDAPIGGLKVVSENGWFAARPSGTEDIYKVYAESFLGADHLARIQEEARTLIDRVFTD